MFSDFSCVIRRATIGTSVSRMTARRHELKRLISSIDKSMKPQAVKVYSQNNAWLSFKVGIYEALRQVQA